ncbi:MAG: hypothetical protein ACPKPY_05040 [Nitrososphaeraceae archaeon]
MNNITLIALIVPLVVSVLTPNAFFDSILAQKKDMPSENIEDSISTLIDKLTRGIILDSPVKSIKESMNMNTSTIISTPNIESTKTLSTNSDESNNIKAKNDKIITPNNQNRDLNIVVPNSGQNKFIAEITKVNNLEVNSEINKPILIHSNTIDNFNKELIKFCANFEHDSFSCVDVIKDSLHAIEFTNSYSGATQMTVPIGDYVVKLNLE